MATMESAIQFGKELEALTGWDNRVFSGCLKIPTNNPRSEITVALDHGAAPDRESVMWMVTYLRVYRLQFWSDGTNLDRRVQETIEIAESLVDLTNATMLEHEGSGGSPIMEMEARRMHDTLQAKVELTLPLRRGRRKR